jgi:hypothetical protein
MLPIFVVLAPFFLNLQLHICDLISLHADDRKRPKYVTGLLSNWILYYLTLCCCSNKHSETISFHGTWIILNYYWCYVPQKCRLILFSVEISFGLYIIPLVTENFWLYMQLWLIYLSSVWAYVRSSCCLKSSKVNDTTWHEILQCHLMPCCLQPKSIKLPETFC